MPVNNASTNSATTNAKAAYFMQRSHNALASAKLNLDNHLTNDCINRLYYAALYATKATRQGG
jgi:uncharacterized protein (UPF0332 family)